MRAWRLGVILSLAVAAAACGSVSTIQTHDGGGALARAKAGAAPCGEWLAHYLVSTNCAAEPILRAEGAVKMAWKGHRYLVVNRANEAQLVQVDDPRRPDWRATSNWNIPNQGDSDADLVAIAVCDDCRWGVAWYKLGTVVFDLGTGSTPAWVDHRVTYGATTGQGGATWGHGGAQWLATSSLGADCQGSTLYQLAGLDALTPAGCVLAGTRPVAVVRGLSDRGSVYLVDSSTRLYHYLAGGAGLTYQAELGRAAYGGNSWSGLDAAPGLLVAASSAGTRLWDTTAPLLPVETALLPGSAYVASVQPPLLVTAAQVADQDRERVWDVRDPAAPVLLDAALWPDSHPCPAYQSSTLVDDVLYSWRWSVAEVIDLADCTAEPPYPEWIFLDGFETGSTSRWSLTEP